jgi:ATP-binding cassette subfamily B protein
MADLILVLEHGRLVQAGRHRELLDAGGLYAELYRLQARVYA